MPSYTQVVFSDRPVYLQTKSYAAKDDRKPLADLISPGVVAIPGVVTAAQSFLVSWTAGMGISVAAGVAYISGQNVVDQGIYRQYNATSQAMTVTAADPTNPRIDSVILRVLDNDSDTSAAYEGRIEIVPGTPTAGATLVNLNGKANLTALLESSKSVLLLGYILVPNAAVTLSAGALSDQRVVASHAGNIGLTIPTASTFLLDATSGTMPANNAATANQYVYQTDTKSLWQNIVTAGPTYTWTQIAAAVVHASRHFAGGADELTHVVLNAQPILDVGILGQIRAGRQLALTDFTTLLGLTAPVALYNLSDRTDISGNARTLTDRGTVAFGKGITGAATEAAIFTGGDKSLYIADSGAGDPFRIPYGSWGCWFKTAKTGVIQELMYKVDNTGSPTGTYFGMNINASNVLSCSVYTSAFNQLIGTTPVADGKWHSAIASWDGTDLNLYVDGVLEATAPFTSGPINPSTTGGPFNIGSFGSDATHAAGLPFFGVIDELFVTQDVLTTDQVRMLYAAKVAHGYATTPNRIQTNIRRLRKGAALTIGAFPSTPLRMHNFVAGALTDGGSGGVALTNNGAATTTPAPDGSQNNAFNLNGTSQYLSSTDTGLPSGTASRSMGAWFKSSNSGVQILITYGTGATATTLYLTGGLLTITDSVSPTSTVSNYADGAWHFAVAVYDNTALDGLKQKLYVDGKLVANNTVFTGTTLAGANGFRLGANSAAGQFFAGQIARAFVIDVALTPEQVNNLYALGSLALPPSPKNEGDAIEGIDATNVYLVNDTLDSQFKLDMMVAA